MNCIGIPKLFMVQFYWKNIDLCITEGKTFIYMRSSLNC